MEKVPWWVEKRERTRDIKEGVSPTLHRPDGEAGDYSGGSKGQSSGKEKKCEAN